MRNLLFLVVCCLCLCGCGNKLNGYQLSELKPNIEVGLSHLKGTIKNESNNKCDKVKINVTFSSGNLKDNGWVTVKSPEIGETKSFNELFVGASNIDDIENYEIKFNSIECWDY